MNAAQLLREAAAWRLFALLFERPRPVWSAEVELIAREVDDEVLREAALQWVAGASEGDYLALLGPGGAASPREVGYRGMSDPGWILAELAQFYGAFAYRPAAEDPPDHVSVEAGFVSYLWLKEAYALENGDDEAAAVTAQAREQFVAQHLAHLAAPLAARLVQAGGTPLAVVAQLLASRVPEAPAPVTSSPVEFDDACGTCGTAFSQETD